jgi:hypothetical protein
MRGGLVAQKLLSKVDQILDGVIVFSILGGGVIIHTLTAMAIKENFGVPWSVLSFLFPVISETCYLFIQLQDEQYNYTAIIIAFLLLSLLCLLLWQGKKLFFRKISNTITTF